MILYDVVHILPYIFFCVFILPKELINEINKIIPKKQRSHEKYNFISHYVFIKLKTLNKTLKNNYYLVTKAKSLNI